MSGRRSSERSRKPKILAKNENRPEQQFGFNVYGIDLVQRVLDDMASQAARSGKNSAARVVGNIRRDLVGEIDKQVPEFADARAAFSNRQKMIEALTEGRRIFDRGIAPDELAGTLKGMNPGEREMFTHGARLALADAQRDTTGAATRIL